MVPIAGIGNAAEPLETRQTRSRAQRGAADTPPASTDGIAFSEESLKAASAAKAAAQSDTQANIRKERIEQARENIAKGVYQMQDVVEQVAARLTPYL